MPATLATGGAAATSGTTGLASVAMSLLLVIGLIIFLGWLVSRMRGLNAGGSHGPLKVAAAVSLGMKERLVLVEAAGAWLLLAVTPGNVRLLHRYEQRPEGLVASAAPVGFAALLDRLKRPGVAS